MAFWNDLSNALGFGTMARSFKKMVSGNLAGGIFGSWDDYLVSNGLKQPSAEQQPNSAITESNNSGIVINKDGSSNVDLTKMTDSNFLNYVAQYLLGANPELSRMWNTAESQKERDWQTDMSNTAYQRSVADMKEAGINPILAYAQGGASSSSGASASGMPSSASSIGPILSGVGNIIETILNKDMQSDAQAHKAAMDALKYKDSHSATQVSNEYYKTLNKLNNMTLSEAKDRNKRKVGF